MILNISNTVYVCLNFIQKEQGKKCLARHLEWPVIDVDENMQKSIHLDYLYDILMFCVEKGFQWEHVCTTVQVSDQLLIESIGKILDDFMWKFYETELYVFPFEYLIIE